jgi:hypothetical protein
MPESANYRETGFPKIKFPLEAKKWLSELPERLKLKRNKVSGVHERANL